MLQRFLLLTLLLISFVSFAASPSTSSPVPSAETLSPGSHQSGTEQVLRNQNNPDNPKGKPYTNGNVKPQNKPTVGARQSSSEQIFGTP